MTICIHWREVLFAYVRVWGLALVIPILVVVFLVGMAVHDRGIASVATDWRFTVSLLAFKVALYAFMAAIQIALAVAVGLVEVLLSPTSWSGISERRARTGRDCEAGSLSDAAVARPLALPAAPDFPSLP